MKIFTMGAVLLTIAACAPDSSDNAPGDVAALAGEGTVLAADGAPPEGRYRATDENGVVLFEELRADGSYTFFDEQGEVLEEGSWVQKSPQELCFTALTVGASEKCYEEQVSKDGIWRTTDPETGAVSVVERVSD